jgi:hypothetical protein
MAYTARIILRHEKKKEYKSSKPSLQQQIYSVIGLCENPSKLKKALKI